MHGVGCFLDHATGRSSCGFRLSCARARRPCKAFQIPPDFRSHGRKVECPQAFMGFLPRNSGLNDYFPDRKVPQYLGYPDLDVLSGLCACNENDEPLVLRYAVALPSLRHYLDVYLVAYLYRLEAAWRSSFFSAPSLFFLLSLSPPFKLFLFFFHNCSLPAILLGT